MVSSGVCRSGFMRCRACGEWVGVIFSRIGGVSAQRRAWSRTTRGRLPADYDRQSSVATLTRFSAKSSSRLMLQRTDTTTDLAQTLTI